jgi:hypothetical protein
MVPGPSHAGACPCRLTGPPRISLARVSGRPRVCPALPAARRRASPPARHKACVPSSRCPALPAARPSIMRRPLAGSVAACSCCCPPARRRIIPAPIIPAACFPPPGRHNRRCQGGRGSDCHARCTACGKRDGRGSTDQGGHTGRRRPIRAALLALRAPFFGRPPRRWPRTFRLLVFFSRWRHCRCCRWGGSEAILARVPFSALLKVRIWWSARNGLGRCRAVAGQSTPSFATSIARVDCR